MHPLSARSVRGQRAKAVRTGQSALQHAPIIGACLFVSAHVLVCGTAASSVTSCARTSFTASSRLIAPLVLGGLAFLLCSSRLQPGGQTPNHGRSIFKMSSQCAQKRHEIGLLLRGPLNFPMSAHLPVIMARPGSVVLTRSPFDSRRRIGDRTQFFELARDPDERFVGKLVGQQTELAAKVGDQPASHLHVPLAARVRPHPAATGSAGILPACASSSSSEIPPPAVLLSILTDGASD